MGSSPGQSVERGSTLRHRRPTTSKYAKLASCSTDTALRDIRDLLRRGVLMKNSRGGRSTSYQLADSDEVAG